MSEKILRALPLLPRVVCTLWCALLFGMVFGQPATLRNPVMSGYNPDPSICRVGNDYYMVTSSFTWYPGIPVYHSRDLVNWEIVSHVINRPGMVDMEGLNDNDGTWAATIRYHDGIYYVITTASKCGGNFYCTATSPRGPWSDPVWLKDAEGIDPSLFWDANGKCYYTGNTWGFKKSWPAQCAVWLQEIDLKQGRLVGERKILTYGHANNATYAEGPHLYKVGGRYLLLMAEGGSSYHHAITAHHSKSIFEPYIADKVNPVLSHRHLGRAYPVQNIGHADLMETQDGQWYAVALGSRKVDGIAPLGRETFLCKVDIEDGTPIFNAGSGRVLEEMPRPDLPWSPVAPLPVREEFHQPQLPNHWYQVRTPRSLFYQLNGNRLELQLQPAVIDSLTHSAMLIRKLKHLDYDASLSMTFSARKANEQAGLVVYRSAKGYFTLLKGKDDLVLTRCRLGKKEQLAAVSYNSDKVLLRAVAEGSRINFYYAEKTGQWKQLGGTMSVDAIADNKYNKFNGPGIGLYATSNGKPSKNKASYDWFEYKGKE